MPPVTRALLFINIAVFAAQYLTGDLLLRPFALWPPASAQFPGAPSFQVWQLLTYGFLHGGFTHLFFNMFALYMFGGEIERVLGTRRYLTYYLVCVVGAALTQLLVIGNMDRPAHPHGGRVRRRVRPAARVRHVLSATAHAC